MEFYLSFSKHQTEEEWREVFLVTAAVYAVGALLYGLLASGEKQVSDTTTGCPKKTELIECCWSHGTQDKSPVAGTTSAWKVLFWSFLTKTKQDQATPSHVHGKIWPHSTQFRL